MVDRWLVFFTPAPPGWWSWAVHGKFQHVAAAGYDVDYDVWVFFDPGRAGTVVELARGDAADLRFGQLAVAANPNILRVTPERRRRLAPPVLSCTAAVKSLLGIRSRALFPRGLYRDLKAAGAEVIVVPCVGPAAEADPSSAHELLEAGPAGA